MARTKVKLPATVDEAVRLLQSIVPQAEQAKIAALQESALITLDLSLGMWIRNNLGMWQGNAAYFSPSWTAFQAERGRDFSVIVDGISN